MAAGQSYTWTYSAETGVFKNHALSNKLLQVSARKFKFVPFTQKIDSFGRGMGESITLIYYKPLSEPTTGKLQEDERIPIDQMTSGTQSITIYEWGRGVEYTNLAQELGKYDEKSEIQKKLLDQMQAVMDKAAADAFTGTDAKVIFIPTSMTGGTWDTDGTASSAATNNVSKHHISTIRDYMINDLHVPFFTGEHFIGLFTTKALRGLRNDRVIESWNMYLRKGDLLYRGEIGQVESVRFIEVNHESALSNSVGTGNVLGEAVIFGNDAVGRIETEFPHLRAQPNYAADFGRRHAVAWYGLVGYGVKFPTANDREARIVRITSQ